MSSEAQEAIEAAKVAVEASQNLIAETRRLQRDLSKSSAAAAAWADEARVWIAEYTLREGGRRRSRQRTA